ASSTLPGRLKFSHHVPAKSVNRSRARERHQRHLAGLAGLEPHRGPRREIEAHATSLFAVEFQGRIGFEEMIVAAYLNRPVAGVGDRECHGLAGLVELNVAGYRDAFTWEHMYVVGECRGAMVSLPVFGKGGSRARRAGRRLPGYMCL